MPDSILSKEIRRDVNRQRFGTKLVKEEIKPAGQALSRSIPKLLVSYDTDNMTKTELNKLTAEVRALVGVEWSAMWSDINPQLMEVALIEGKQITSLYDEFAPEDFVAPTSEAVATTVRTSVMTLTGSTTSSGTWSQYIANNTKTTAKIIDSKVREGFNSNLSLNEIVQQLRGKYNRRTKQFVGGVINGTATSRAEALARTGLSHYSSMARDEFAKANSDVIVSRLTFITLDNRTTTICLGRNGDEYKIGEPYPPLPFHYNCRTIYVFKTPGFDPSKTERVSVGSKKGAQAEANYNRRKNRLDTTRENRAEKREDGEATPETASKVTYKGRKDSDTFLPKLIKGDMGSDEWMRSQETWFQDSSLGKKRADLFRSGVGIDKFTDMTGRQLTLQELKDAGY